MRSLKDRYAAMAQLGANAAIAIGFNLIADCDHDRDQCVSSVGNDGSS